MIQILSHKAEREGKKLHHQSEVLTDKKVENEEEFVFEVANATGFSPYGFDCFNEKVESIGENKYLVKWTSYATCE